jgi:hypothetical protein
MKVLSSSRGESLDALDLEQLIHMRDSRGWALAKRRVESAIAQLLEDLVVAKDGADTARLQGRIEGARRMLATPEQLIVETKEKLRRNGKRL